MHFQNASGDEMLEVYNLCAEESMYGILNNIKIMICVSSAAKCFFINKFQQRCSLYLEESVIAAVKLVNAYSYVL